MCDNLRSCEWLDGKLSEGTAHLVVVDVTSDSTKDCQQEYANEHIPGAFFLDVMNGKHTDLLPRNIPSSEQFQHNVRAAGIDQTSHVVVYSSGDKCGFYNASRAWWTFKVFGHSKVSVLDGGLKKWKLLGLATSDKITATPKTGNFIAKWTPEFYRQIDDVVVNMSTGKSEFIDSRPAPAYAKEHITGAASIPMPSLVDEEKSQLKSATELKKLFSDAGIDLSKSLITHCNSGMSSCTLFLAATLCGNNTTAVYHGGVTEWKIKHSDKMEKTS